jgi:4-amino-4-deoxy-L-arabinose transferase-like glycosyltransferase
MISIQAVGAWKFRSLRKAPPILLIAIFLASHMTWVLADQRVWPWDQAMYGVSTLQLWDARILGIGAWIHAMTHAVTTNPPLLVWIGQFLVPLQALTGDIESALLFVNVIAAAGTLTLVYFTGRRFGAGLTAALAAVLTCAGSQIFIELTNHYLLEALQCCAAASMVFVAWRAEQRSLMRTFALLLIAAAFSFLTKTSSGTFVLPLLVYAVVCLLVTRRRQKPAIRLSDVMLLCTAIIITSATLVWYMINWNSLIQHFANATVSDVALYWGSAVYFPAKIAFWTQSLASALSPFYLFALGVCILIAVALTIAILRSYCTNISAWMEALVENGGLFALALTGTIVATLCAFSLQINEDRRFLMPLIPLVSILVAWSLATIRRSAILALVMAALTSNAVVTGVYAHGGDVFYLIPPYGALTPQLWRLPVQPEPGDKLMLTAAVRASCHQETVRQPNFVAIDYPNVNVNSANFYSEKERTVTGLRCFYMNYGTFQTDVQQALNLIERVGPAYVLTVAPGKQLPVDSINAVARLVAEHIAHDARYELVSDVEDYILIYKRARVAN